MIEGPCTLRRTSLRLTGIFALVLPAVASAHGGHAEVGALAHPLAHAPFFLAALLISVPALVRVVRRLGDGHSGRDLPRP